MKKPYRAMSAPAARSAGRCRSTACFLLTLTMSAGAAEAVCTPGDPVNIDPIPAKIKKDAVATIKLDTLASGLVAPTWGISAPGDDRHLFVADIVGQLWAIDRNTGRKNLVLDVSKLLVPLGLFGIGYDERGFLGVAFHPGYRTNGLLYTYTSEDKDSAPDADFPLAAGTGGDHRSRITEWKVADPAAARPAVNPASRRVVMTIDEPQFNHNGGALNFGPDRMLYISLGDGGAGDDQGDGHDPVRGNGQDRSTVLGKLLRIDPTGRTAANGQYGVPASNPYADAGSTGGHAGCADQRCDEIWAYGFRNPFRFSFDRKAGTLIVGDVGQNNVEEVDAVQRGGNYGWRRKEGRFFFQPNGTDAGFVSDQNCLGLPTKGLIDPFAQYDHDEGIAIVGGFVYRGRALPSLAGKYLFGDYASEFAKPLGRLFHTNGESLGAAPGPARAIREFRIAGSKSPGLAVFGFGQDARGELYVLGNKTGVPTLTDAGKTGVVMKLVPVGPSSK